MKLGLYVACILALATAALGQIFVPQTPVSSLSGTAPSLTAGNVTTNANLTGPITSVGNATTIASQSGTGNVFLMNTGPSIVNDLTFSTGGAKIVQNASIMIRDTASATRANLRLSPNGSVTNFPSIMEIFGTDFSADGTNYERLSIRAKGSGDTNYVIFTDAGGSGTVRPIQIATGANSGLTLATDGSASYGGALAVTGNFTPSQTNGIVGTTTNNNANAGSVGELSTGTTAANTTSLSTGTTANVGAGSNITLTAGDWDCDGAVNFTFGATTSITNLTGGISATSATLPAQDSYFDFETSAIIPTGTAVATWVVPTVRILVAASTNVFLVSQATFSASTLKVGGTIRCRRMR